MKDFTKGVIVTIAAVVICKKIYNKGYCDAVRWAMSEIEQSIHKDDEEES